MATIEAVRRQVKQLADRMGLRDWKIRVARGDGAGDEYAYIECAPNRKAATITLTPRHDQSEPDEQRATLVHELLHAHFCRVAERLEMARSHLTPAVYEMMVRAVDDELELGVDAVAEAWADQMVAQAGRAGCV